MRLTTDILMCCGSLATALPAQSPTCGTDTAARADVAATAEAISTRYVYLADRGVNWPAAVARTLGAADSVRGTRATITLLEPLLEQLWDSHVSLRANTARSPRLVPSGLDLWAEWRRTRDGRERAVVTAVRPDFSAAQAGVRPGMTILAIDDVPIADAVSRRLGADLPHPVPPTARDWALLAELAGRRATPRRLRVADVGGAVRTVALDQPGHRSPSEQLPVPPVEVRVLDADGRLVPVTAGSTAGAIGYVRLNALGDEASVAAFDTTLETLRGARALVLDLRNTPGGGNTSVAEPILGRFITDTLGYQRVVPRDGSPWVRTVAPRGPWTWTRPVAVLVGRWTGSMGEGMAIAFDGMRARGRPRGVVVGTRMAGLAGAVEEVTLPCSGVGLGFPTARLLHLDGTPRERWRPPVLVDLMDEVHPQHTSASGTHDLVLARALRLLRRARG
ncbi:MAG: S41 family peptidase [Gemmatimonadaceae bacterium]|jgi:carboxyl-terminal processing protease|nr:S41 family peptidase [Gemmatimonadaceae bacterium]